MERMRDWREEEGTTKEMRK